MSLPPSQSNKQIVERKVALGQGTFSLGNGKGEGFCPADGLCFPWGTETAHVTDGLPDRLVRMVAQGESKPQSDWGLNPGSPPGALAQGMGHHFGPVVSLGQ